MENEFLEKVYGYREIKKELKLIQDWYFNADSLGERKNSYQKVFCFTAILEKGKRILLENTLNHLIIQFLSLKATMIMF